MKTIKNIAAQGDMFIKRVDSIPQDAKPEKAEAGRFILAHSETGHHHTVKEKGAQVLIDKTNAFIKYLKVDKEAALIVHERSFDTHETIKVPPGVYRISNQREYTPEGYRRASD